MPERRGLAESRSGRCLGFIYAKKIYEAFSYLCFYKKKIQMNRTE
jgi:hypothetical protein